MVNSCLYYEMIKMVKCEIICKQCGKIFLVKPSKINRKFCSKECNGKWQSKNQIGKNNPNYKGKTILICKQCGCKFEVIQAKTNQLFCNKKCATKYINGKNHHQYKRIKLICEQCKNEFDVIPYWKDQRFCSTDCFGKFYSGENHSCWKGGIKSEREKFMRKREYTEWRLLIFDRDNYTCQECGDKTGGNLNAHHIIPYRDCKDTSIELHIMNGITLCEKCHIKIYHKEYDYTNKYLKITRNKK